MHMVGDTNMLLGFCSLEKLRSAFLLVLGYWFQRDVNRVMCLLLPQDEQTVKGESTVGEAQTTSTSQDAGLPALPNKDLNRRVALLSTLGAVALFVSQRLNLTEASLKDLAANSVPYEEVSTYCP